MDVIRKRLLFRAQHMGMKETDRIFGGFAAAKLPDLDDAQLKNFETLLEEADPDLLAWVMQRQPMPADIDHELIEMIIDFKNTM